MKLFVLSDNNAGIKCRAEWGLSYYIQGEKNILFDFGASNLFLENAVRVGLDISKADVMVLSHGHWDHGTGLKYLQSGRLICHPEAFTKRYNRSRYVGLPVELSEIKSSFDLQLSRDSIQLAENIYFLGEIPRKNSFEAQKTVFSKEDGSEDFILDDSGIVIVNEDGLNVISGCAHAGICNTVQHAIEITGIDKVNTVMGGFHLQKNDEITQNTSKYFKKIKVEKVIPSHCTEFPVIFELCKNFNHDYLFTGKVLEF